MAADPHFVVARSPRAHRLLTAAVALTVSLSACTFNYRESYLLGAQPGPAADLAALHAEFPGHAFAQGTVSVPGAELATLSMTRNDARATVLYFGGNAYRSGRSGRFSAAVYADIPVDLVIVDHRGYGTSSGSPSIAALRDDALRAYDLLAADPAIAARPLIVHGQSLGSFLAGHVASQRRLDGLVLESSATSTEDWVAWQRSRLPWWKRMWVRRIRVDDALAAQGNLAVARGLDEPVLYVVGADDLATPPQFTRQLHAQTALPDACRTLLVVPGRGHNDATRSPEFRDAMSNLVAAAAAPAEGPRCGQRPAL